jgi:hypothetical protein
MHASSLRRLVAVAALLADATPRATSWTLDLGQRIAPRGRSRPPELPDLVAAENVAAAVSTTSCSSAPVAPVPSKPSLFDLPAVEAWATAYGLQPFHVKRLYDALLRGGDPSGGVGRGRRPLASAALASLGACPALEAKDLEACGFPKRAAADLLAAFTPCGSRVSAVQRVSAGALGRT